MQRRVGVGYEHKCRKQVVTVPEVPDTHGCRGWQAQDVLSRLLEYREADADGQQAR